MIRSIAPAFALRPTGLAGTDEGALLARIARRDAAAFGLVVERYGAIPHRIAARMLGSPVDAEDIAQEALLRLWRLADQAGTVRSVPGWLQAVATNLCLDRLRQRSRRSETDDLAEDLADGTPGADVLVMQGQAAHSARQAIARLPDRQRAAIVLTYYEELSNAAAADMLGMTIKAFESLLFRARSALRQELSGMRQDKPEGSDHGHG
ncbi:sigma-70 family RNA polymerase sigma factor [Novosphingobium flavum]|uniref:RNA polymerase sigma factor n=1 Tax=Novosphingobium aerophilum TaxID=2839843 RepID=UPI00163A0726|nr:sigma-70 family RNA polymerase sigma factor [Novosphingobium aerophilum]MBC2662993.1 sigma-70 family RNA polymerase sigma factor [Novosphingobium aerophilum]